MEVEEIVEILSKKTGRNLIMTRTVKAASSIAKSYMTYVITLWELFSGEEKKKLLVSLKTGLFTGEHKKGLVHNTERDFITQIFMMLKAGYL